jgi:hypothetical protein
MADELAISTLRIKGGKQLQQEYVRERVRWRSLEINRKKKGGGEKSKKKERERAVAYKWTSTVVVGGGALATLRPSTKAFKKKNDVYVCMCVYIRSCTTEREQCGEGGVEVLTKRGDYPNPCSPFYFSVHKHTRTRTQIANT